MPKTFSKYLELVYTKTVDSRALIRTLHTAAEPAVHAAVKS